MFSILILGLILSVIICGILVIALEAIGHKIKVLKTMKVVVIAVIFGICVSMFLSFKIFTTMIWYNYESKNIATKGVFFKDMLMLNEHRLIGSSDLIIFKMDKYSRSDRQLEVINVIVNGNKDKE